MEVCNFFAAAMDDDNCMAGQQFLDRPDEAGEKGLILDLVAADFEHQHVFVVH